MQLWSEQIRDFFESSIGLMNEIVSTWLESFSKGSQKIDNQPAFDFEVERDLRISSFFLATSTTQIDINMGSTTSKPTGFKKIEIPNQGSITGLILSDVDRENGSEKAYRFTGIPYALPPVGERRWKSKFRHSQMRISEKIICRE